MKILILKKVVDRMVQLLVDADLNLSHSVLDRSFTNVLKAVHEPESCIKCRIQAFLKEIAK